MTASLLEASDAITLIWSPLLSITYEPLGLFMPRSKYARAYSWLGLNHIRE